MFSVAWARSQESVGNHISFVVFKFMMVVTRSGTRASSLKDLTNQNIHGKEKHSSCALQSKAVPKSKTSIIMKRLGLDKENIPDTFTRGERSTRFKQNSDGQHGRNRPEVVASASGASVGACMGGSEEGCNMSDSTPGMPLLTLPSGSSTEESNTTVPALPGCWPSDRHTAAPERDQVDVSTSETAITDSSSSLPFSARRDSVSYNWAGARISQHRISSGSFSEESFFSVASRCSTSSENYDTDSHMEVFPIPVLSTIMPTVSSVRPEYAVSLLERDIQHVLQQVTETQNASTNGWCTLYY